MLDDAKFTEAFHCLLWKTWGTSGEQHSFFFFRVSDNPFAINISSTQWNRNMKNKLLKFLIIGCCLWKAGTDQGKKKIKKEEHSQFLDLLTTRANVTFIFPQSSWKNVKSYAFVEKKIWCANRTREIRALLNPGWIGSSVMMPVHLRFRVHGRSPTRKCFQSSNASSLKTKRITPGSHS